MLTIEVVALVTLAFAILPAAYRPVQTTNGDTVSATSPGAPFAPIALATPPATNAAAHLSVGLNAVRIGPNLASAIPNGAVRHPVEFSPGCTAAACPMGVTDYGITPALTTYSYKFIGGESYWDSGTTLGISAANGGGCVDPNAVTLVCFTIQQNGIVQKMNVKNSLGYYWTQNVPEIAYDGSCSSPCVSGTYSLSWLDNIWNFSYSGGICPSNTDSGRGCINPATVVGNQAGRCLSSGGQPMFYYCAGPIVYNLTLPFTVTTWTDVNSYGPCVSGATRSCINFYGSITDGGTTVYTGYYDAVAFLAGKKGIGHPFYEVQDKRTPIGLPQDFEWVLGGPGGGSNNAIETFGEMQSFYCASNCGNPASFHSIKHAWSSGYDTAETISDAYMIPNVNPRDLAVIYFATDNPQSSLW